MRVIATLTSCCRDTSKDFKDGGGVGGSHDFSSGAHRRQSRSGSLGGLLDGGHGGLKYSPGTALVIGDPELISQPSLVAGGGDNLALSRHNTAEPMPASEAKVEVNTITISNNKTSLFIV